MLFRKISNKIEERLKAHGSAVLVVEGARQVGKSFIIREVGKRLFKNYVELNLLEDSLHDRLFADVKTVDAFYLRLGMFAGKKLQERDDTLVFLDEIQVYPELLTLLKFLRQDDRYSYIASGSELGIALAETSSIPMGSIELAEMFPLDFEEFLLANGFNAQAIDALRVHYVKREALSLPEHEKMLDLFRRYLLIGGLPDAVNAYLETKNIARVRAIQENIHHFYEIDASKYDAARRLKIRRIYAMIPSTLENKKKRIVVKAIENKTGKTFSDYQDEFDYLVSSGIALAVQAVSSPVFPLPEKSGKNLLKLYLNDVGLLTGILYRDNVRAVLDDQRSVNLGTVYENAVASELRAHGHRLYYYDNRDRGEVDFLIDDFDSLSVVPLEVKSGKDYTVHSALTRFTTNPDYHVREGRVLSNAREITTKGTITYYPVYFVLFM